MRLVLDTNVLISALGWDGNERAVLLKTFSGEADLLLSEDIIAEFIDVLSRDRFAHIPSEKVGEFIEVILETSIIVDITSNVKAVEADPDDDRILECAKDGQADYIVSGDRHLLELGTFENVHIVRAGKMMDILQGIGIEGKC